MQGILTGVGFLGAGVILRDPAGHVTGLTTAATIWVCAVLGLICGLGYWFILGVSVVLTAPILSWAVPWNASPNVCSIDIPPPRPTTAFSS